MSVYDRFQTCINLSLGLIIAEYIFAILKETLDEIEREENCGGYIP